MTNPFIILKNFIKRKLNDFSHGKFSPDDPYYQKWLEGDISLGNIKKFIENRKK